MITRWIALVWATLLLTGCTTAPAPLFQAAWFLAATVEPAGDTLYIGLLNQSDAPVTVAEIIINRKTSADNTGWQLKESITLEPGQMLIRPASNFKRNGEPFPSACHLPISVAVFRTSERHPLPAEIRGRLPNFLPADWERKCTSGNAKPAQGG